jgi:hypothetical protein
MYTIKKNTEVLLAAGKEVSLEVNAEKTTFMVMSHHQNGGQNHIFMIGTKSFGNVVKWKHFKTAVTNKNCIHEGIKRELIPGNACCQSVQNVSFSSKTNFTSCFVWV